MNQLPAIIDRINQALEAKNQIRDVTLTRSRELIRQCANAIRAAHRRQVGESQAILQVAQTIAAEMITEAKTYPDVYFAGYTQDALKELAEAHITYALIAHEAIPTPEEIKVEEAAYLNGLAEAAGELRRYTLDALRRGEVDLAERVLNHMDEIYSLLITVDFPNALTDNLRRNTDMVRGVLERTRGDVTTAVRQEAMKAALLQFERRLGLAVEPNAYQEVLEEAE